ncbi:glycosyltransferase [Haloglomus litoreum]|uniref:glycosyltransferase n=1 Tax=Haloglomus litoreum TaxID=3034026 RepID=UPI0023E88B99|nr:glycosyltransferase [Haloglomus sp. DT116]
MSEETTGGPERVPDRPSVEIADLNVAIAHWRVRGVGGAVRVAGAIAETLDADRIYTVDPPTDTAGPSDIPFHDVLDDLSLTPLRRAQARVDRVFEYGIWEDVDWRDYGDIDVLVTSGATPRAVVTPDDVLHINYCHSPPRWFYDLYHERKGSLLGTVGRPLLRHLRTRDAAVDRRVDHYLANSPVIARRLWKYYDREAEVLYPPVPLERYRTDGGTTATRVAADPDRSPRPAGDYYLHLGRLDDEKGVEAVVEAFADTDRRLLLAGPEGDVAGYVRERVERLPNVEYHGYVSEAQKRALLSNCRAVVFNGHKEDFGIVPVEANASDKACLVNETGFPGMHVEEGENGYTHDGTPAGIRTAIARFERDGLADGDARAAVEEFSRETFENRLRGLVAGHHADFQARF